MIVKNGKNVIGVQKGSTPITKIYKGNNLVFSSKNTLEIINPSEALACDVVFANKETEEVIIVRDWNESILPPNTFEPIGIVVIPGSHGVLKDGTGTYNHCGVMSIVPMSFETPEIGNTIVDDSIYWGYNSLDISGKSDGLNRYDSVNDGLINYQQAACDTSASNISTQLNPSPFLPRQDSIGGKPTWPSSASSYGYTPSPYKGDDLMSGEYNEAYSTTEFDTDTYKNVLADFKGIQNTKIITNLATAEDWKNLSSLSNSYSSGYYPAACCCARFHTTGTKAFKDCTNEELKKGVGFWYLPACGELGYILPRLYDINDTIDKLNQIYKAGVQIKLVANYGSSSERSANHFRYIYMTDGRINYINKNRTSNVVAFMRLGDVS